MTNFGPLLSNDFETILDALLDDYGKEMLASGVYEYFKDWLDDYFFDIPAVLIHDIIDHIYPETGILDLIEAFSAKTQDHEARRTPLL